MPPDLVGVVIPAYIGAFSSLAGVVVAVVALVTARRARADARGAASASTLVAEREQATRAAALELVQIVKQLPETSAPTLAAAAPMAGTSAGSPGGVSIGSAPAGRRPREPKEVGERRPYWADRPRPAPAADPSTTASSTRGADAVSRRLDDLVQRLSE